MEKKNINTSFKNHFHAHLHYYTYLLTVTELFVHMYYATFCPFLTSTRWISSKKYSSLCVKYLKPTVFIITTETNAGQYTLSASNIH